MNSTVTEMKALSWRAMYPFSRLHWLKYKKIRGLTCFLCACLLCVLLCLLTCCSMNEDTLVGPQVAEVKQHHIGGDVVHGEGCRLLEAHALWDEEGVARRHHRHLLPQPEAVQHHHLVADLEKKAEEDVGWEGGKAKVLSVWTCFLLRKSIKAQLLQFLGVSWKE